MDTWNYLKKNWRVNVWNITMAALLGSTFGVYPYTGNFWLALAAAVVVALVWIVASFVLITSGKLDPK